MTEPEQPFTAGTSDDSEVDEVAVAKAANRFDIRRLIGALFMLYGLILVVLGAVGSHHIKTKADGININLWTGLAMLVFGALMVFWALARPTVPKPEKVAGEGPGQIGPASVN
jgi:cell division septal protein FtsQ